RNARAWTDGCLRDLRNHGYRQGSADDADQNRRAVAFAEHTETPRQRVDERDAEREGFSRVGEIRGREIVIALDEIAMIRQETRQRDVDPVVLRESADESDVEPGAKRDSDAHGHRDAQQVPRASP